MPDTTERRTVDAAGAAGDARATCGERADVLGRRAAAAADDVHPALGAEALDLRGQHLAASRCSGPPRRAARRSGSSEIGKREISASVRRWSVMKSGPVAQLRPMAKQVAVRDRDVERLDRLPGEHRAHRLDRHREHDRDAAAEPARSASSMPSSAALTLSVSCCVSRKQDVDAALDQRRRSARRRPRAARRR